jgi:hypothetical protein
MRLLLLLLLLLGVVTVLGSGLAWRHGAVTFPDGLVTPPMPVPEDGRVLSGIYVNEYFDLSFPLPEGWKEGNAGPVPSDAGYYVLGSLIPRSELNATILIAAQDLFFAEKPYGDMAEMARDFRQAMSDVDGMTIDREPTEIKVDDRIFHRVDFSGVGLYRATFMTVIRCHAVSVNLTAKSPELLDNVALSINRLSAYGKKSAGFPHCIENYAVPDNLVKRVEPVPVGARFVLIPVRIIVDTAGAVKHIHVIHASAEQRQSIEEALRQWKFKPYEVNGRTVEIETGLVFRFVPART